ncbi:hypothetical protein AYJ00_13170 [Shewanella algae]|nr:hypothetical protein AYJ00_13170 [Shewanella algae]
MISKYHSYSEYKAESNADWLGYIPQQWTVLRGKYVFKEVNERSESGNEILLSVSEYYGVKPRSESIAEGEHLSRAESLVGYKKCEVNDLVMNIMLAWKRGQGVTKYSGIVSPAYSVYRFFNNANPDFMHYLFRTDLYTGHFKTRSTGVIDSRLRLYPESFFDVSVLLPSIEEQRTIAAFLDYETARIDSLIDKQQRLIELLKEKRQAVISHAVTKGLNPDALLKDSGVEWLGQVPEHWDMPKLKWHCATVSGGTPSTAKHEEYYEGGKFPWVRTTDLNNSELFETPIKITQKAINDTACSLLPKGSVLVAMYGGAGSIGKHARLMFPSTINQAVCGILPNDKLEPSFLHLYVEFYRPYWMVGAEGTRKDPNIGQDHIRDLVLACPPLSEQRAIVEYVDKYRHQHQLLEAKALTAIKLMQERRTALISAAVTGKIDLRGWTAPREG